MDRHNKSLDTAERPACLKVWEAARIANCGSSAIRRGVAEGRIPHIRFGRNILIPRVAFLRWLESCGAAK